MFKTRKNEPQYAKLWDKETKKNNVYGDSIETVTKDDIRREVSLNINGDGEIGDNPNRYKQHGFYFNADNCIGCHACESACSEKNDVPSHLAFRSVGFVEGGSFPNYQRLNISMACNHCDDPVCLKGCPTRAYTKFAEYGAVLQDPDICFGCGYCTWVCPYNAPQLDPVEGVVSKCNMCVDRLEVGLKPVCVAACLGNALDFGVIDNVPENREQAKTNIPGFPTTDITHPNIRFQQTKDTQRDMTRPDGMPIKYHKTDEGEFRSMLDNKKHSHQKHWGLDKLFASHENAHAIFTICAQAVMGATMWVMALDLLGLVERPSIFVLSVLLVLLGYGLFTLNMHLGKPQFFYRGFYNLRHSPVSREIAGVSLFFMGLMAMLVVQILSLDFLLPMAYGVAFFGLVLGSYYMMKLYLIPARAFWNHWQTGTAFYGTMLSLGGLLFAVLLSVFGANPKVLSFVAVVAVVGLVLESIGLVAHKKANQKTGEGQAADFEQTTTFGKTERLRYALLGVNMLLMFALMFNPNLWLLGIGFLSVLTSVYLGRILFYAVVIPTTMPGAFFWKNDQFKAHAIESGLSDMPQMGVMPQRHHKFDVKALMTVIKQTTLKDAFAQIKSIVNGG
ncbi:Anaerobic dimethyl sulfoxide reductase chain B [Bathymodiolus thermophilus thioautotrophic gill symbiont]|uniref:DmsC/YnfH family molybdoenzyme membrane anchor subunit n=1 Tax=Bathymodiolus thermophilus thioautotrophic gill symbiont TaxID=2360 RepID=UPI0010B88817|nr:DmsC/YnfH family molybdoenzyme membrane anchor subunit [Bathymodiolus thermophilus thioautotrophic gill symbiont]SGZ92310.1 Anaerobic dimethyl sulfoxide reductase chain B [Bathymodiolus thermophilus thioautotrophic gill symbiont]